VVLSSHDAFPLPPRPSLERYRKLAKDLVKACRSGDPAAIRLWAEDWTASLVRLAGLEISPGMPVAPRQWAVSAEQFVGAQLAGDEVGRRCALSAAQFVLARLHGFASWARLARHLEEMERASSAVSRFESAADAVVAGDAAALRRLLSKELVRARSAREHNATLLHYVAANGVEGYRQRTPTNIAAIAEMLLDAGAEVDSEADLYGRGATTLGLAATSAHPERAGVQQALMQVLLDRGARLDPPSGAGRGHSLVRACLANGRGAAAEFLAGRGAPLGLAEDAGVGRLDEVKAFFAEAEPLKAGVPWEELEQGFLYACQFGRDGVVEFLLEKGVDIAARDGNGQTGLHWAVIGGRSATVKLLLRHSAPVEAVNGYGGTPAGQALWSAEHGADAETTIAILETLRAGGARIPARWMNMGGLLDAWFEKDASGSR
jgi:hypothetical protein